MLKFKVQNCACVYGIVYMRNVYIVYLFCCRSPRFNSIHSAIQTADRRHTHFGNISFYLKQWCGWHLYTFDKISALKYYLWKCCKHCVVTVITNNCSCDNLNYITACAELRICVTYLTFNNVMLCPYLYASCCFCLYFE